MLLWLAGCATFTTPDGEERVRGALWVDGALANADGALVVVANSPVPCRAEEVADDPATDTDEAAAASAWWEAQLQSAVTREGAAVLVLWLGGDAAAGGEFTVAAEGWMGDESGQGGAMSLQVREAAAPERDGAIYLDQPVDYALRPNLTGAAAATVREADADVTFAVEGWEGTTTVERCDNPVLANVVMRSLVEMLTGS
jgi:hypothetical protein